MQLLLISQGFTKTHIHQHTHIKAMGGHKSVHCLRPAAPETTTRPSYWLLHKIPGRLSVREVLAEMGDAFSVVDRMLGLRMIVLKRDAGCPASPPRIPRAWMHENQTSITHYDERQVRKCHQRNDTDVVIVHCLKEGALTLNAALVSLEAMKFPLRHVLRVFLGGRSPQKERTAHKRSPPNTDGGATLHQIYVQMASVAHASAIVPDTNPLRPRFDAVACDETGCVLHVLQLAGTTYDERRAAHVHELSHDTRMGRCALSGLRRKTTVSVVTAAATAETAETAKATNATSRRPPRVPAAARVAAALKRQQERESLEALVALEEALEDGAAAQGAEECAPSPVNAAAASAAASAVAAVFAGNDDEEAPAAAAEAVEAETKQAAASASCGGAGGGKKEPARKYVFRFVKPEPAEKAVEEKKAAAPAAADAAAVSVEERKTPDETRAAAAASATASRTESAAVAAPAAATPARHVTSAPLRWADDSCTAASSGGGVDAVASGRSGRGDVAEYTHPSNAASALPPLEMLASEEWSPARAGTATAAPACTGYPPLGAWETPAGEGAGAVELWSWTQAGAAAAAAAQYPAPLPPLPYCGTEGDVAEQTAAVMDFYAQMAYHHVRSINGPPEAAVPHQFPPHMTSSGYPYGGEYPPLSQTPPPLYTPTATPPASKAVAGGGGGRQRGGSSGRVSGPGASTTGDGAIGLRMAPLRMPPAVAAAAAAAAATAGPARAGSRACSGGGGGGGGRSGAAGEEDKSATSLLVKSLPTVTWQRGSAESTMGGSAGVTLWRTCCSLGGEVAEDAATSQGGGRSSSALCSALKKPKKVTVAETEDIVGEACTQTDLTLEMLDEMFSDVRC